MAKFITAKYPSKCAETGAKISKGESMLYDYDQKLCYCQGSKKYQEYQMARNDSDYVTAMENAYYDRFCSDNNI